MMRRFYSPDIDAKTPCELDEIQSNHISKVLRYEVDASINVFDGKGNEYECTISVLSRKKVVLDVIRSVEPKCPESPLSLILGIPMLKGNKSDLIVHKAVELGVTEIAPFHSHRSEVPLKKWKNERASKIAIEASKQCGRATLPNIREAVTFEKMVATLDCTGILFYEEDSESLSFNDEPNEVFVVTGPEGGFEESEIKLARSEGFEIVHLNGRILKAETAAIVATALTQHHYGDFN